MGGKSVRFGIRAVYTCLLEDNTFILYTQLISCKDPWTTLGHIELWFNLGANSYSYTIKSHFWKTNPV